ncbi:MAG TPA: hypothetical protein VNA69_21900 [Thermoanaerobaculia bacterium]|nr:hypothetical protein [Thermoanaerobaculia bacterium]
MTRRLALALLLFAACKSNERDSSIYELSRSPVSVRGWINDVAGAKHAETMEMEIARRTELFTSSSVWVENSQYSSGGIAENGAFIVLDVPPLNATIGFNAPGAEAARLVLKDVPGSADVFIPDVVLENGGAKVLDPKKILIRVPADVSKPAPTGKTATVAGHTVPIIATPLGQLADRREYPSPGGFRPVATFK